MAANDEDRDIPSIVSRYIDKFEKATAGKVARYTDESRDWFRKRISRDTALNRNMLLKDHGDYLTKSAGADDSLIGRMYYFKYSAHEAGDKDLGVYDQYPCVFIFNAIKNEHGNEIIYAVNMHYLSPKQRFYFLSQLLQLKSSTKWTKKTKLKMTWKLIKKVSESKLYLKAVHAYRADRFQSQLIEIDPRDWEIVTFLPLASWRSPPGGTKPNLSQSTLTRRIGRK